MASPFVCLLKDTKKKIHVQLGYSLPLWTDWMYINYWVMWQQTVHKYGLARLYLSIAFLQFCNSLLMLDAGKFTVWHQVLYSVCQWYVKKTRKSFPCWFLQKNTIWEPSSYSTVFNLGEQLLPWQQFCRYLWPVTNIF